MKIGIVGLPNVGKSTIFNAITKATLEDFDKGSKTTQIVLKTYDDGNVADKSTQLATQAVASAQALISCLGSVGCLPQQKVSATAGVPLIGPIAGAAPLRGKAATTTYAVRASASSEVACLLNFASTTGLSNVSVLVQDDGFGKSYAAELDKAAPGFPADEPEKTILVGFGHKAVLGVADKVVEAVKAGKIRHFFLVGGCDGAKPGRNYYTEFVKQTPKDTVVLTLACGKYRFNDLDLGEIGGIPRLLDMGQCNDAYSAIQVAIALAGAFECEVNKLPLTLVLSWYEQKAVCILLTLLALGIKNIYIGPSLPAFLSGNVLKILVEKFNLHPITTPEQDLKAILG